MCVTAASSSSRSSRCRLFSMNAVTRRTLLSARPPTTTGGSRVSRPRSARPIGASIALLFTVSRFLGSCDALECRLSSRRALLNPIAYVFGSCSIPGVRTKRRRRTLPLTPRAVVTRASRRRGGRALAGAADARAQRYRPPLAAAVEYVAPAPVVVAARLGAPRQVRGGGHHFVVGAISRRGVRFAPAHVENVLARVGIGLTTGAVCARDIRAVRKVIRHHPSAHVTAPPASKMPSEVSGFR